MYHVSVKNLLLSLIRHDLYQYWPRVGLVDFIVFNATFNSISAISWRSVWLGEETGVPRETTDLPQFTNKLSHNVVSSTSCLSGIQTRNVINPTTIQSRQPLPEWVFVLFTSKEQFFSYMYMMARTSYIQWWWWCLLCTRPTCLVGYFKVLAHWNSSPRVDMSLHSDTLSWFSWANQFLVHLDQRSM